MKRALRRSMRAALRAVAPEVRHRRSLLACRRLAELPEWRSAGCVFVYLATSSELDTTSLIEGAWRDGKQVAVPRVIQDRPGAMDAVPIGRWSDCLPGFRGILEPFVGAPVAIDSIDFAVVPGIAFATDGHRLGQGGGYYDRFLAHPELRATLCGIAFEEQVVERVPVDPHDRPVDVLITDAGELRSLRPD